VTGKRIDTIHYIGRELGAGMELISHTAGLLGCGNLTSEKQPHKALWQRLTSWDGRGQRLLELRDSKPAEANTLRGVGVQ